MAMLRVSLFGRPTLTHSGRPLSNLNSSKAQELFFYLLLHRQRPSSREVLASLLWHHTTTAQSKAYLRRALWKLRSTLNEQLGPNCDAMLLTNPSWVQCNPGFDLWLDVEIFEQAFKAVEGVPGRELSDRQAKALEHAVQLHEGDLLENYYQEWCLYERERFRHLYLVMLDKVTSYYETNRQHEKALSFAERILVQDQARECTHRQVMRLRYHSGDRTGALHQYERCRDVLQEDLGVAPATSTRHLYEQIRADCLPESALETNHRPDAEMSALETKELGTTSLHPALDHLKRVMNILAETQQRVQKEMEALEEKLQQRKD